MFTRFEMSDEDDAPAEAPSPPAAAPDSAELARHDPRPRRDHKAERLRRKDAKAKVQDAIAAARTSSKKSRKNRKDKRAAKAASKTARKVAKVLRKIVKGKKRANKREIKRENVPRSERRSVPCCVNFPRARKKAMDAKAKKLGSNRAVELNKLVAKWCGV